MPDTIKNKPPNAAFFIGANIKSKAGWLYKPVLFLIGIEERSTKEHYKFVSVDVSLANRGERRFNYKVSEFKLQDNQDRRKYKHAAHKDCLPKGPLKPGELTRLVLVYEIREWNTPAKLIYTPRPWFLPGFLNEPQIIDLTEYHPTVDIILIRHGDHEKKKKPSEPTDEHTLLTQEGMDKINRLKDQLARLNLNPEIYLTSTYVHARQTAGLLSDGKLSSVHPIEILTPHTLSRKYFQAILDKIKQEGVERAFQTVLDEVKQEVVELSQQQTTVAVVGHEKSSQLNKISACLTTILDKVKQEGVERALQTMINAKQAGVELSQQTTVAIVGHHPQLEQILSYLTLRPQSQWPDIDRAEAVWVRADSLPHLLQGKGVVQAWISGDEGPGGSIEGGGSTESE